MGIENPLNMFGEPYLAEEINPSEWGGATKHGDFRVFQLMGSCSWLNSDLKNHYEPV
jgi:hypothetical protein